MMTKTYEELLPCPHCGKPPKYECDKHVSFHDGEIEIITTIFCENPDCNGGYDSIAAWNTRVNKEAEFLEELKAKLFNHRFYPFKTHDEMDDNLDLLINSIEQFQAEQKGNNERT